MKQIELVIKLPIKTINRIKSTYGHDKCCGMFDDDRVTVVEAIVKGTPLPKGHGRLKDATTLKKMFEDKEGDDFTAFHFYDAIEECPTIIEADKEGAEE